METDHKRRNFTWNYSEVKSSWVAARSAQSLHQTMWLTEGSAFVAVQPDAGYLWKNRDACTIKTHVPGGLYRRYCYLYRSKDKPRACSGGSLACNINWPHITAILSRVLETRFSGSYDYLGAGEIPERCGVSGWRIWYGIGDFAPLCRRAMMATIP